MYALLNTLTLSRLCLINTLPNLNEHFFASTLYTLPAPLSTALRSLSCASYPGSSTPRTLPRTSDGRRCVGDQSWSHSCFRSHQFTPQSPRRKPTGVPLATRAQHRHGSPPGWVLPAGPATPLRHRAKWHKQRPPPPAPARHTWCPVCLTYIRLSWWRPSFSPHPV